MYNFETSLQDISQNFNNKKTYLLFLEYYKNDFLHSQNSK